MKWGRFAARIEDCQNQMKVRFCRPLHFFVFAKSFSVGAKRIRRAMRTLENAEIGELLAQAGAEAKPPLNRAFKRAARAVLLWPLEAIALVEGGRTLTELKGVGPYLEKVILRWLDSPPQLGPLSPLRSNFLTRTEVAKILSEKPDWMSTVRGDLQMHTEWSDGSATVAEMAEAAAKRSYQYIGITDHAKGLKIAGGINEEELEAQAQEILAVNATFKNQMRDFQVLRSVELNLDVNGQGDLDPKALQNLDLVLGAFHSALRKKEDQTERYINAMNLRGLHILGHPRGRIYNYRLGLQADWLKVFETAAKLGKAVEIDCYPDRQDLDVERLKLARKAGVNISLGTDSHHSWQLEFIEFGLAAAALVHIPKERIINFWERDKLLTWAKNAG
jgi:histidinol phosphatase-like PHP family hydrolase